MILIFSFPGSAWERTAPQAVRRQHAKENELSPLLMNSMNRIQTSAKRIPLAMDRYDPWKDNVLAAQPN